MAAEDTAATGPTPAGPVTAEHLTPTAVEEPADMLVVRVVGIAAARLAAQPAADTMAAVAVADSTAAVVVVVSMAVAVAADSTAAVVDIGNLVGWAN